MQLWVCVSEPVLLISGVFEHSVLCVWEIYAFLENMVFYIAVYGPY